MHILWVGIISFAISKMVCSCGRFSGRLLPCIRSGYREPDTCSPLSDTLTRQTHAPLKITPLCSDMFSSHAPGFQMCCICGPGHVKGSCYHPTVNSLEALLADWQLYATTQHFLWPPECRLFSPIIFRSLLGSFFGMLIKLTFLRAVAKSHPKQSQTFPLSCTIYHPGAS